MRHKKLAKGFSVIVVIALLCTTIGVCSERSSADINLFSKLSHTMATQTEYNNVKDLYIPRMDTKEGADSVKAVTYDSSNKALVFTMTGWYNSAGAKIDVTSAVNTILSETSGMTEDVTVGISAELKGGGRDGGFGFLKDTQTNLETLYIESSFTLYREEMSLSEFKSTYSSFSKMYVGFFSGNPAISIRNFSVYYYTGQREVPVEMESEVNIPDGSTGLKLDKFEGSSSPSMTAYSGYKSSTVSKSSTGLLVKSTADSEDNGFKMDVTSLLNKGESGDSFGASLRVKVDDWSNAANKANKCSLFFEVRDAQGNLKSTYPLASEGPNENANNITNSTAAVGEGWLTKRITGESAVEFEATDLIYLCAKEKNITQYYNEICLWGNIDAYEDVKNLCVTTPVFNENKAEFTVSNLTDKNCTLTIKISHYNQNAVSSIDEYELKVPTGSEEIPVSLAADQNSRITIKDDSNVTYVNDEKPASQWTATWSSAQLTASGDTYPTKWALDDNTYRQMIRTSVGGNQTKLTFSNEYGTTPLEIKSVHLAKQLDAASSQIDTSTDTIVTFGGEESVTIPEGKVVTSDEVVFPTKALDKVAVSTWFGSVPKVITSHTGARCNNWVSLGNRVSDSTLDVSTTYTSWYFLEKMQVITSDEVQGIVCFGDSITDGYATTTNLYNRWSDVLADKLKTANKINKYAVLNKGIGGNAIFGGLGTAAKDRFKRDVLDQPGVKYVVLLEGINDIGASNDLTLANRIIEQYKIMVTSCHAKGIKIYAGTILPFKKNSYYSAAEGPVREQIRQAINTYIRSTESTFDGYVDFDAELRDPSDPEVMKSSVQTDYLHPNPTGYAIMGDLVYQTIFNK